MRREHLSLLVCPTCQTTLELQSNGIHDATTLESGTLTCSSCQKKYPIIRGVPRFVSSENYASGFGYEWTRHARTQYDSHSGCNISEKRFFEETRWDRQLPEELVLEVGSGSGRFTEQAAKTGATIVSVDFSYAVDANFASNGTKENVLIVQADIYELPFRKASFDKVCCLGVLQHTPDVEKSFKALPAYLKPGGRLAVDVYRKETGLKAVLLTKYLVRPWVKGIEHPRLYKYCERYIKAMWALASLIHLIPFIGRKLNSMLLVPDYRGLYGLSEQQLQEWAILDLFDVLSPAYDQPQTVETLQRWFTEAGLEDIEVHKGYNGVEGRGRRSQKMP